MVTDRAQIQIAGKCERVCQVNRKAVLYGCNTLLVKGS